LLEYHLQELGSPTGRDTKLANEQTPAPFSGFSAATYVNHRSKHVVLAIAGTKLSSLADLKNDLAALLRRKPQQFDEALDYFRSVLDRYKSKLPGYTFACTGHSLGGGACAYAAAILSRPSVTLNPIGSKWISGIPEPSKPTIVNYIDPNDLAYKTFSLVRLPPVGQLYWIKDPPHNAGWLAAAKKIYRYFRPENSLTRLQKSIEAHSADGSLTRLAQHENLPRLQ
jgi:hypothetical protein